MKKTLFKKCVLVLALLAVTLPVRLIGINHGAPHWILHPDVRKQAIVAGSVYKGVTNPHNIFPKDLDPENFQLTLYPYGSSYITGKSGHFLGKVIHNNRYAFVKENLFFWAFMLRILNTVSFALALFMLILLLYDKIKLLPLAITGLVLVLEPFHAQYSHYGMNDIPVMSVLLMAWISSSYIKGNAWQKYGLSFLTGFLLGAGMGIKYQAIIGLMFPGFIWLDWLFEKRWSEICASVSITAVAFIAGTYTTCPLLWKEPGYFFSTLPEFMHWQAHILRYRNVTGKIYDMDFVPKVIRNTLWCLRFYIKTGLIVMFPALAWGCIVCKRQWRKHPRFQLILSSLAFFLFMNLVIITCRDMMRPNDLLVSSPFLILLFGLMLDEYADKWKEPPELMKLSAMYAACCILIICFLVTSILDSVSLTRNDTRLVAKQWCKENLKPGNTIIRERYTLSPRLASLKDFRLSFLSHDSNVKNVVRKGAFHYLMSSSMAYERFIDPLSVYYEKDVKDFYENLPEKYEILAEFRDRKLYFTHPVITVYGKKK